MISPRVIIFFHLLLFFYSCSEEQEITFVTEPKVNLTLKGERLTPKNVQDLAIIVGIVNQSSQSYFFKFMGKKEDIQKKKKLLKELFQTIKFSKGKLTWKVENPWKKLVNNSGIPAEKYTIDNTDITFTITQLPYSSILSNVNRWRQQLSLNTIGIDELRDHLQLIHLGNVTVHYIEIIP